ncbi:MAG: sulfotransferase [Pseudomonadota bacterium]
MVASKTTLIVTGVARSGTTALAELLNAHPEICVGIERFKFQYLRAGNYDAGLFTFDRFFDFKEEDTNIIPAQRPHWKTVYDAIEAKWEGARIVGDKVPDLTPILGDFFAENPGFKYIYILRNLKDVALSWQARADRARDRWPASRGFAAACKSWDEQQTAIHEFCRQPEVQDRLLLLDYDRMFDPDVQTEQALLGFLDLQPSEEFTRMLESHREFTVNRPKKRVPKKFVSAYKDVDMGTMRALRRLSQEQMQHWSSIAVSGCH